MRSSFTDPKVVRKLALLILAIMGPATLLIVGLSDDWLYGYLAILSFYAVLAVFMFAIVKPTLREGGLIFLFFTGFALVFIVFFAGLYHQHNLYDVIPVRDSRVIILKGFTTVESLYFSVEVFTTLGFGDIIPRGVSGKIVVATEAIMGMTYVATAIITFLGRKGWAAARGAEETGRTTELAELVRRQEVLLTGHREQQQMLTVMAAALDNIQGDLRARPSILNRNIRICMALAAITLLALGIWLGHMMG
ncbi:two pore domain potassium channel family protein [Pseudomonas sp. v388]|uniref:potassium channel family protein n=1 Tax=Pseudomonas sp. v388 TaxID=2479849 RepID=UPI000F7B76E1|nr:potassium channel family protein [Pseudomonas sp. v388]RRV10540.1 two pore domain potassium channel family protein [Pseudomonas sp. v388]